MVKKSVAIIMIMLGLIIGLFILKRYSSSDVMGYLYDKYPNCEFEYVGINEKVSGMYVKGYIVSDGANNFSVVYRNYKDSKYYDDTYFLVLSIDELSSEIEKGLKFKDTYSISFEDSYYISGNKSLLSSYVVSLSISSKNSWTMSDMTNLVKNLSFRVNVKLDSPDGVVNFSSDSSRNVVVR